MSWLICQKFRKIIFFSRTFSFKNSNAVKMTVFSGEDPVSLFPIVTIFWQTVCVRQWEILTDPVKKAAMYHILIKWYYEYQAISTVFMHSIKKNKRRLLEEKYMWEIVRVTNIFLHFITHICFVLWIRWCSKWSPEWPVLTQHQTLTISISIDRALISRGKILKYQWRGSEAKWLPNNPNLASDISESRSDLGDTMSQHELK